MTILWWIGAVGAALAIALAAGFGLLVFLRYRRRPRFTRGALKPLEQRLLAALVEHSEAPLADRLRRQIELMPVHCRLHFEKMLSLELYPEPSDRPALDSADVLFPNRSDFRVATLSFRLRGQKFKAQFGATGGRLFDMIVRPNPGRLLHASDIEVTRYQLGENAFEVAARIPHDRHETPPQLTGLLADWSKRYGLGDVYRPLDARTTKRALAPIDAMLPADYIEMMRQTDGFTVGTWRVLGLAEIYRVALGDHNYYYLADDGAVVACVREGSKTGTICTCAIDDVDAPIEEGTSLAKVIDKSLSQR